MTDLETFKQVDYLATLDDDTLTELIAQTRVIRRRAGARIVAALESGADVFVIMSGHAEVVVEPRRGARKVLGTLGPGSAFGEMSSLTGALRSATVIATDDVEIRVIRDETFDRLRERRPEVAVAIMRTLGNRLADADRAIDGLLADTTGETPATEAAHPGSIRRVWRELVVNRHRDLTFLTLMSFVIALVVVRLVVYASFRLDLAPRGTLRTAYMSGFALLVFSAGTALLTFRPGIRKLVAIAYGVGVALIFNELGVTLAFDIFFKDIHTADPDVAFDVERLYRRTEPLRAIVIGLVVLIQAAYLRQFYRRVWFIVTTRVRRLFATG
ncbi:MAG TPA: cyclic nucleotide-binding domain-containing protein [Kofleriaceae bacterium]|nr:cyclic nucleotide-binding domain-containing protein [Kofleriaceae bacterium]